HFDARGPEGAVRQLCDRDDFLAVGQANTRRDLGAAGLRTEIEIADIGLRVLFVEDVNAFDVVLGRHRVRDAYRHRHGVAVLDQRRNVELDLADLDRGRPGNVADRGR